MSMLTALDESEHSADRGWTGSNRFDIAETADDQQHWSAQDVAQIGTTPEAVVEEEVCDTLNEEKQTTQSCMTSEHAAVVPKTIVHQQASVLGTKYKNIVHHIVASGSHPTVNVNNNQSTSTHVQMNSQVSQQQQLPQQQTVVSYLNQANVQTPVKTSSVKLPAQGQKAAPVLHHLQQKQLVQQHQHAQEQTSPIVTVAQSDTMPLTLEQLQTASNAVVQSKGQICVVQFVTSPSVHSQTPQRPPSSQKHQYQHQNMKKMTITCVGNSGAANTPPGAHQPVQTVKTIPKVSQSHVISLPNRKSRGTVHHTPTQPRLVNIQRGGMKGAHSFEGLPLASQHASSVISSSNPKSLLHQLGSSIPKANSDPSSQETVVYQDTGQQEPKQVVLQGGGNLEENGMYCVETTSGSSRTVLYTGGHLIPCSLDGIPLTGGQTPGHHRGGQGRGQDRGKGRFRGHGRGNMLHGNATGLNMAGHIERSPVAGRQLVSSSQIITLGSTSVPSSTHQPAVQQISTKTVTQPLINTKNLMPPATGSQKQLPAITAEKQQQHCVSKPEGEDQRTQVGGLNTERQGTGDSRNVNGSGEKCPKVEGTTEQGPAGDSKGDNSDDTGETTRHKDPNKCAVCQFCGCFSYDLNKCERCSRKFNSQTRYRYDDTNKRKLDSTKESGTVTKKVFYGQHIYSEAHSHISGGQRVTVLRKDPAILKRDTMGGGRRGRPRGRGRGTGRGTRTYMVPETVTISSDEEEEQDSSLPPPSPANSNSSSHNNNCNTEEDQNDAEFPIFPDVSSNPRKQIARNKVSRVERMEDRDGRVRRTKREQCASPLEIMLIARNIRVGSFRGAPIEPVLMSKEGINFYMEGYSGTYKFYIRKDEFTQCLARFDIGTCTLFFMTTQQCAARIRKDLGMKPHTDMSQPVPDPYFDPAGRDMTHQLIMVTLDGMDATTKEEYKRIIEFYEKVCDQNADDSFFLELSKGEAEDVLKKMSQKRHIPPPPPPGTPPVGSQLSDHAYSCSAEDEKNNMVSPVKVGFEGPVVKLLTYPPPPATGGITITNEDLYCLNEGEFLNDVIIDFYLKYLLLARLSERDRQRTHVFSSFFYKRLTQRQVRNASEDDDPGQTPANKRHARVKTWTRHVDLFSKDFIIVPINEHAHWFLAIICFPGLEEPHPVTYIPKDVSNQSLQDMANIPTPPPCGDMVDEMDGADPMDAQSENTFPDDASNPQSEVAMDTTEAPADENNLQEQGGTSTAVDEKSEEDGTENREVQATPAKLRPTPSPAPRPSPAPSPGPAPSPMSARTSTISYRVIRGRQLEDNEKGDPGSLFTGLQQPCILVFDSLSGPSRSRIVTILKEYLQVEWAVKKKGDYRREKIKGSAPKCPQQNNYSDCGVFVLQYVESFFEDPIQDFSTPMKGLHDWFTNERIDVKREELMKLILSLKEQYEKKAESAATS